MLRLYFRPKHMNAKIYENHLNPIHVGIHWIALKEYSQMSTLVPGFQSFFRFFVMMFPFFRRDLTKRASNRKQKTTF